MLIAPAVHGLTTSRPCWVNPHTGEAELEMLVAWLKAIPADDRPLRTPLPERPSIGLQPGCGWKRQTARGFSMVETECQGPLWCDSDRSDPRFLIGVLYSGCSPVLDARGHAPAPPSEPWA